MTFLPNTISSSKSELNYETSTGSSRLASRASTVLIVALAVFAASIVGIGMLCNFDFSSIHSWPEMALASFGAASAVTALVTHALKNKYEYRAETEEALEASEQAATRSEIEIEMAQEKAKNFAKEIDPLKEKIRVLEGRLAALRIEAQNAANSAAGQLEDRMHGAAPSVKKVQTPLEEAKETASKNLPAYRAQLFAMQVANLENEIIVAKGNLDIAQSEKRIADLEVLKAENKAQTLQIEVSQLRLAVYSLRSSDLLLQQDIDSEKQKLQFARSPLSKPHAVAENLKLEKAQLEKFKEQNLRNQSIHSSIEKQVVAAQTIYNTAFELRDLQHQSGLAVLQGKILKAQAAIEQHDQALELVESSNS